MDIKPLKIPLIRQDPKSDDCLRACAQMVFSYFKDPVSKEEIWKKLHVYKKHSGLYGTFLEDFGKLASKRGYAALIFHHNYQSWDKDTFEALDKSRRSFISALKNLKSQKVNWPAKKKVQKEISFVQSGGNYQETLAFLDIIDSYLIKRIPVLTVVSGRDLYESPNYFQRHFILVIGKKENDYIIRDSFLALDKIPEDKLQFAIARNGGYMMVIIPQPKKPQEKNQVRQSKLL